MSEPITLDYLRERAAKRRARLAAEVQSGKDKMPALRVVDMTADILAARRLIELTSEYGFGGKQAQPFQGEQIEAVRDFIAQLHDGPRRQFSDIATMAFGTKRYAHWPRQRCDVDFGMCPKHGQINMSVALRPAWRGARSFNLPADLVAATVRVLEAMLAGDVPTDALVEVS